MALLFKNANSQKFVQDCEKELGDIKKLLKKLSRFDVQTSFLTRYALLRSAASLETAYKSFVADHCEGGANSSLKNFFELNFRNKAANLKFHTICRSLSQFDKDWVKQLKKLLKVRKNAERWKSSLNSLVELRNDLAHGGRPTVTFSDIEMYFKHAKRILIIVEKCIK